MSQRSSGNLRRPARSTVSAASNSPASEERDAQEVQVDRGQGPELRGLGEGPHRLAPRCPVGKIERAAKRDPPGSRIDGIRDLGEPQRTGPIVAQRSSHRGPVVQRRGHRPGHRRGPGLDPGARLGRRQPRDVDPGIPEGPSVIRVGPRAVGVAGPGRADIDQLLQKLPVGLLAAGSRLGRALLRRDGCHQGLDLRPAAPGRNPAPGARRPSRRRRAPRPRASSLRPPPLGPAASTASPPAGPR